MKRNIPGWEKDRNRNGTSKCHIKRGPVRGFPCLCCWLPTGKPEVRDSFAIKEGIEEWQIGQEHWSWEFWPTKKWDDMSYDIMEGNDRKARGIELPSPF